ncbi:flagellin N-terminal helical domain-containing protein [Teichococcus vastitatis]|uniref:flagellin N-terminal helical domain-containing protein n=1 Tax=Teichococcus vastitatis TaxID=2307076 RepID=UPI000E712473|nr:flagellin [Pseudoroseomonas vastitatis]
MYDRVASMGVSIGRQSQLNRMQSDLARLTGELSSGRKSDPARELGVGASLLYKLRADIQQGDAIANAGTLAGQRLTAMQDALSSVGELMDQMSSESLQAEVLKDDSFKTIASNAREVLGSMMDLLNTSWNGQSLFAGLDSATKPLSGAEALTGETGWVQAAMADLLASSGADPVEVGQSADGAADGTLLGTFNAMFNNTVVGLDDSFYGVVYQAASRTGGEATQVRIGAGETLQYDMRADNPAFRDAFHALSLLSLLDQPDTALSKEAKSDVLREAGTLMRGARSQLTTAAGILGAKQERLERVGEIQDRTVTAAAAQINDLEGVDYYTISDKISTLQIQLQATYSITAQISKLSLVNYL